MSRLCRLRNKSHGEDGQWAYEEITKLREQVAAQAAEIKTLEIEFGDVRDSFLYYKEMTRAQAAVIESNKEVFEYLLNQLGDIKDIKIVKAALAIPTNSTQILDDVRRAERERVARVVEVMDGHATSQVIKTIRAME